MGARETLEERGWLLFPALIDEARCRDFLGLLESIWSGLGEPATYCREDVFLSPEIIVSPVGMAVLGLLGRHPQARELLLPGPVVEAVGEALGPRYRLENVAGVLSDHTRPFFFWHHHLGGLIDAQDYLKLEERYPILDRLSRLSCTFYPVPLDDEHGVMLLHPRRLRDPTNPISDDMSSPWPGQIELRCPPGSVLLMDQCVWHAVTPMARPGRRAFAAGFLVAE